MIKPDWLKDRGPKNLEEALEKVAYVNRTTVQDIIDREIVTEYDCEDDKEEFTTWYDANDNELPGGTPIGYSIQDKDTESGIIAYYGLREVDEDPDYE